MLGDSEHLLQRYVGACRDVFGDERLTAIVLHGSSHKGGFIPGYSDIDFMVFLAGECFDEYGLRRDLAYEIQEHAAAIDWASAGALYYQAYYYDPANVPSWWTGPIAGAHRALYGAVPPHLIATNERLRTAGRDFLLRQLPSQIRTLLIGWADSMDHLLPQRARLVGSFVNGALYSLLAVQSDDAVAVWSRTRFENLAALETTHADVARAARRYLDADPGVFVTGVASSQRVREAFAAGIEMLIATHRAAASLTRPAPVDPV